VVADVDNSVGSLSYWLSYLVVVKVSLAWGSVVAWALRLVVSTWARVFNAITICAQWDYSWWVLVSPFAVSVVKVEICRRWTSRCLRALIHFNCISWRLIKSFISFILWPTTVMIRAFCRIGPLNSQVRFAVADEIIVQIQVVWKSLAHLKICLDPVANRSWGCAVQGTTGLGRLSSIFGPGVSFMTIKILSRIDVWSWPLNYMGFSILTSNCWLSETNNIAASI
jgi:hypothetical protein